MVSLEDKKILWDAVEANADNLQHILGNEIGNGLIQEDIRFCVCLMRMAEKKSMLAYMMLKIAGVKAYN